MEFCIVVTILVKVEVVTVPVVVDAAEVINFC
jgi:hypothetical protein